MPSLDDSRSPTSGCVVLVATRGRWTLLIEQCLPCISRQARPPALVVVVNDGVSFSPAREREIQAVLAPVRSVVLENRRAPGPAGAWNTGLLHLRETHRDGFVALLDDDDAWDDDHLDANHEVAVEQGAEVVVSGLRRVVDGAEVARSLPNGLTARDFLVGNPGWQGSNTYVAMRRMVEVRGFRDGLPSLNDRDLAVRLLQIPGIRVGYTGSWTSSWHVRSDQVTLSTARSPAKISGLRWFWRIYGPQMSPSDAAAFFERAVRCFGVQRHEIVRPGEDDPLHTRPHGDLEP